MICVVATLARNARSARRGRRFGRGENLGFNGIDVQLEQKQHLVNAGMPLLPRLVSGTSHSCMPGFGEWRLCHRLLRCPSPAFRVRRTGKKKDTVTRPTRQKGFVGFGSVLGDGHRNPLAVRDITLVRLRERYPEHHRSHSSPSACVFSSVFSVSLHAASAWVLRTPTKVGVCPATSGQHTPDLRRKKKGKKKRQQASRVARSQ